MKRRHAEFSEQSSSRSTEKKRKGEQPQSAVGSTQMNDAHRAADAMSHLSERADDLIECLQTLKKHGKIADPVSRQRLASLSRELLPSLHSLAAEVPDDTPGTQSLPEVPEVPVLTPWARSDVSRELPPLPPILDASLERASFTHAGKAKEVGGESYEKLEWLGDAYLYLFSTAYIYLTFPHLKHGDMAQIREVLVRNATLKDYALHYGFDKRAVFPEEYGLGGRVGGTTASAKERAKVLGDIFEAHVAAIILSDPIKGVSRTASWLKALWSTTIPKQIETKTWQGQAPPLVVPAMCSTPTPAGQEQQAQEQRPKEPVPAKVKLSAELALSEPRVAIDFRSLDEGMPEKRDPMTHARLFTQGAFLVGYGETVQLGTGTDKKKARANEKAAQNALENKKLMNVYREKKRAIQESKRAAQQEASKGLDF